MSRIKSENTKLELLGFDILKRTPFRFRKHPSHIYGRPDAALKRLKIAIFFDSDFWHGYDYKKSLKQRLPNDFWVEKIARNIKRDTEVTSKLKKEGWIVIRLWEHEIEKQPEACLRQIIKTTNTFC